MATSFYRIWSTSVSKCESAYASFKTKSVERKTKRLCPDAGEVTKSHPKGDNDIGFSKN